LHVGERIEAKLDPEFECRPGLMRMFAKPARLPTGEVGSSRIGSTLIGSRGSLPEPSHELACRPS
jgi:hypothetical protein